MTLALRPRLVSALPYGAVFAVAAVARIATTFRHGVLHVNTGYDAAVYFASSDALLHGRLPYTGFVFLHPPGITLALTPFAGLTYLVPDWVAYDIATVAFALLGALNAVLIVRLARRFGLSLGAGLAGGLFYAVWFGAVDAERVTKLEPLGNFLLLIALLLATRVRERPTAVRPALLAGAALGLTVSVKIWWIVPVIAVVTWLGVATRQWVVVRRLLGGATLAAVAVNLPFFLASPRAMWTSVIVDQLGRHPSSSGSANRLADLTALPRLAPDASVSAVVICGSIIGALFAIAAVRAARVPMGRAALGLLAIQLAVLLLAPSWFPYYADYLAIPGALTIAAAAAQPSRRRAGALAAWLPVAAACTVTTLIIGLATWVAQPFHGADTLTRKVATRPLRHVRRADRPDQSGRAVARPGRGLPQLDRRHWSHLRAESSERQTHPRPAMATGGHALSALRQRGHPDARPGERIRRPDPARDQAGRGAGCGRRAPDLPGDELTIRRIT